MTNLLNRPIGLASRMLAICVCVTTIQSVAIAEDLIRKDTAVDSTATTEGEMKPYSEPLLHTDLKIELVPIHGGSFMMGSPETEADRLEDEGPQHQVRVDPFWMGKFEITWDQYDTWGERIDIIRRDLAGLKPAPEERIVDGMTRPTEPYTDMSFGFGKGNYPAICMTQHAARAYCKWLSVKTGHYYRLPTEAEWEYAARAGTTTMYSFGDSADEIDDYAVSLNNSNDQYEEVGTKLPNPWGLHDIHGNVAEWVSDQYVENIYKQSPGQEVINPLAIPASLYPLAVRGGGWDDEPAMLRSAAREGSNEDWKQQDPQLPQSIWYFTDALGVGFRIVRPLVEPSVEEKISKWDKFDPPQLDPVEGE